MPGSFFSQKIYDLYGLEHHIVEKVKNTMQNVHGEQSKKRKIVLISPWTLGFLIFPEARPKEFSYLIKHIYITTITLYAKLENGSCLILTNHIVTTEF